LTYLSSIPENPSFTVPIMVIIIIHLPHFEDYVSNMKIHQSAILLSRNYDLNSFFMMLFGFIDLTSFSQIYEVSLECFDNKFPLKSINNIFEHNFPMKEIIYFSLQAEIYFHINLSGV
jgi:hypothetical protein